MSVFRPMMSSHVKGYFLIFKHPFNIIMKKIIFLLCCFLIAWPVCAQPAFEAGGNLSRTGKIRKWFSFEGFYMDALLAGDSFVTYEDPAQKVTMQHEFQQGWPNSITTVGYKNSHGKDSIRLSYNQAKISATETFLYDSLGRIRLIEYIGKMGTPILTSFRRTVTNLYTQFGDPRESSTTVWPTAEDYRYFQQHNVLVRSESMFDSSGDLQILYTRNSASVKKKASFDYEYKIKNGKRVLFQNLYGDDGFYIYCRPYELAESRERKKFTLGETQEQRMRSLQLRGESKPGSFFIKTIRSSANTIEGIQALVSALEKQDNLAARCRSNFEDCIYKYQTASGGLQLYFYGELDPTLNEAVPMVEVYIEQSFQQR
ncbi:MAG: hypothetical protein EOO01_20500 [Chitinophagaceae bacterium]|nr:MAG: hypothetical protein EOO01_20500 [Chitinophagaceae bacterium]